MACPNCGADLIPGKPFCHACGQATALPCPSCGAPTRPEFRFCPDCGFSLRGDAPRAEAPEPPPPGAEFEDLARALSYSEAPAQIPSAAERKQVTVLFCDLVGSTSIAERLDPEEYRDLLDGYLQLALDGIHRMEGIVNQLAGDGFMALFGAPVSREDAPVNAVQAALQIQADLARYSREHAAPGGFALEARIGIHSGPVVVGTVGTDHKADYTATGDTTNVAARLQSLARPGTILISAATDELTRGRFEVRATGPIQVAGKRDPIEAFEVQRRLDVMSPIGLAKARGLTPLVGFEQELALLDACHERLLGGLPQMVSVVGEAGSGKSRLVYEFKQRLLERGQIVFEARGSPLTRSVPFAPIAQILRQLFEIQREDDSECACDKVARKVGASISEEDYAALCQLVTSGDGSAASSSATGQHALRSVVTLIDSMSEQHPVTVIVEDLHWIDESSLELLQAALSGERRRAAVMLVVTQRPDFQRSWHTSATQTSLQLLPLRDEHAIRIIEARAGGAVPDELERRILDAAEGNPFFLEEITRSLVEQGTLVADDDETVHLTRPVSEIAIPGTVQELIGARLDRLPAAAKRTAQVAAVLGRQFHHERLGELLAGENIDVADALDELERRGILHRNAAGGRADYRFGESLTQAVAYESLLLKERRQLHGRVATLLEQRHGAANASERAGLVAHHLARSENRGKALVSLLHAAAQAEELPSYPNAMELYREAWRLAEAEIEEEDAGEATLRALLQATSGVARVAVLYSALNRADIEEAAIRGIEVATELGDRRQLGRLLSLRGMLLANSDPARFAEGIELIEDAIQVAETDGTAADVTGTERALAWTCVLDGRFDRSLKLLDAGIERLRESGEAHPRSDLYLSVLQLRASTLLSLDDLEAALDAGHETLRMTSEVGNRTLQASATLLIARVHFLRGDYADARDMAAQAIELAEQIGGVSSARSAATLQLLAQLELGEKPREKPLIDQIDLSIGAVAEFARDGDLTIEALVRIGEQERAERYLANAMSRSGGRLAQALDALAAGHVAMGRGTAHWREAARAYTRAKELGTQLRLASIEAAAQLGGAELALLRGKPDVADLLLDKACASAKARGLLHYLKRAARLRAELPEAQPSPATVEA